MNRLSDCSSDLASLQRALSQSVPKTFRDGTHRAVTPGETIARVQAHASRMGITRLGNITGLDHIGIPVAIAVRPKSRSISVFQGKGLGLQQAYASALMEAAEFYHGEYLDGRFLRASYKDLARTAVVVDPEDLCGNGRRFDRNRPIEWIEGYDMLRQEACWVPAEMVHTDMTRAQIHDSGCLLRGSNGLASGNNLAEALSAAICEVVERDAIALWSTRDLRDRAGCHLDPGSIDHAPALDLLGRYERAGIGVRIWNVTSDVEIAAFVCHIREESDNPNLGMRRFHGAGCHPDRGIALTRALTEAAQTRLAYIDGARDDLPLEHYAAPDNAEMAEALLDVLQAGRAPSKFRDLPNLLADDVAEDVRWQLRRLSSIGIARTVAVDLTRPELGIPVVRVVIPGLEGDTRNPEYFPGKRAQPGQRRRRKSWPRWTKSAAGRKGTHDTATLVEKRPVPTVATLGRSIAIIFAGPSLPPSARAINPCLVWRPPVKRGDIDCAMLDRPVAIGIIDGRFDAVPSVQHKEIISAIAQGIRVYGAASMGALRAAELADSGMKGIGRVFQMYRDGTLVDHDDVAVTHGPEELDYIQLSAPMVNIEATIQEAVQVGILDQECATLIVASARCLNYQTRTLSAVFRVAAIHGVPGATLLGLRDWLKTGWVDQKRIDSMELVQMIQQDCAAAHPDDTRFGA